MNSLLTISVVLIVCFIGCSSEEMPQIATQLNNDYASSTRAQLDFNNNWEYFSKVVTSNGSLIWTPWSSDAVGEFDRNCGKDIKKEDGWVLIKNTCDEYPIHIDSVHLLVFYNKKSGDLKIFYYNQASFIRHSTGIWNFGFKNIQGITNSLNEISLPTYIQFDNSDKYTWITTPSTEHERKYFNIGWNCAIIPNLAYDPKAEGHQELVISTKGSEVTISDLQLETLGSYEGVIITNGVRNPLENMQKTLITHTGEKASEWIKEQIGKKNLFTKLMTTGVKGLIKAGVNLITRNFFGSFSESTSAIQNLRMTSKLNTKGTVTSITNVQTGIVAKSIPIGKLDTGVEFGVWNLSDNPTVYLHPVGVIYSLANGFESDDNLYAFTNSGKYKTELVVNTQLRLNMIKCWTECDLITYIPSDNGTYPLPLKEITDFGSIGSYAGGTGVFPYFEDKDKLYKDSKHILYKGMHFNSGYYRLWNKYYKDKFSPVFKYIYAPSNDDIRRGGSFIVNSKGIYVQVSFYAITKFSNKIDTIVNTRTYLPKFEWDPDLVKNYKDDSMANLQGHASSDPILRKIDRQVIENYRQTHKQ